MISHLRFHLKHFQVMPDKIAAQQSFGILEYIAQRLFQVRVVVRQTHDANHRPLPGILPLEFSNGHIKLTSQPVFQAAQNLPLVF